MNIEKFIDEFGDDVYALALIATKDFDSAERVFIQAAQNCETFPEGADIFEAVKRAYPLCKTAPVNDKAETFPEIGLSSKQEALLEEVFPCPQIVRVIIHLCYENDLSVEQIASVTGENARYVSERLSELSEPFTDKLDRLYKELCLKLNAPDELKIKVVDAIKSGEKRLFEVREEAAPRHSWTKGQKAAAVVISIILTALICVAVPLLTAYLNSFEEMNSSYDEVPPELIYSYTTETEHIPSE